MISKLLFTVSSLVSLAILIGSADTAIARRAYSYGGGESLKPRAEHPHPAEAAPARAAASANKNVAHPKKVAEPVADAQKLSVLNVFAPAPVTASTPVKHTAAGPKVDRKLDEKPGAVTSSSNVNRKPQ